ncbi:MAG: response regulator [Desulfobacterales bacterium]|nr:response regulator [Desulfobacterales bacterium]
MKRKTGFKSIKTRILFWLLVISMVPLIIDNIITYHQRAESIREESFIKLKAIRDLKARKINSWLEERIGDITVVSQDNEIRNLEDALKNTVRTEQDVKTIASAKKLMKRYLRNYKQYDEIFIINPLSGKIDISTDDTQTGKDRSNDKYFTNPMKSGEIYIKDIYYSKTIRKLTMTFSIPVYCLTHGTHITGILVARVDLENALYNLLLDNTGLGKTGETIITNKDGIALNELRWQKNAPLNLKIKAEPVLLASQGKTGITETVDYRGEKILAAYTYIPTTQWGFVAKQDLKEVYAPIHQMTRQMVIIILFSLVSVYILAAFLAKNITRPLMEIIKTSRLIERGDLSARNIDNSTDEIGYLATSINTMADSLTNQMLIQKNVAKITETMVNSEKLNDFGIKLLKELIDITESNICSFYILNHDKNKFEYSTSIGIDSELLEPFDASILEGEFGRALAAKQISHIKNIPENTRFKFKTFAGTILPKEIITIPVIVKKKVCAVISLANLKQYSKEDLDTLKQSWDGMNTVFSSLLSTVEIKNLAIDLENKNQELQAQSGELQQQSDELQEQNMELEVQKQQVDEANRLKSEFLSNMSHELRTPLNSVMALSRVLIMQAKEKLSKEETHYLEIIERNGKQLLDLINDILDLSKIEAGRMDVSIKLFSPKITIESLAENLEPLADDQGIKIINNIPDNLPMIESDESRIHKIFQNIIGNAIKFTKKGTVTVSASSNEQTILIDVTDTGIGISKKDMPHIFDEFRQADGSSARLFEGTGLGLAIAFKAARMLGGDITVKSTLNKGTTFTVILPIKWEDQGQANVLATLLPSSEQIKQKTKIKPLNITDDKRILLVEDNETVHIQIKTMLENNNYIVDIAQNGQKAIEYVKHTIPDGIILDLMMPGIDGFEVLEKIRSTEMTSKIPVLILTAKDLTSEDLDRLSSNNIQQLIHKGDVDRENLIFKIKLMLGSQPGTSVQKKTPLPDFKKVTETPTILAVEDNPDNLTTLKAILGNRYNLLKAVDGEAGLEKAFTENPDLVLLDMSLPKLDGYTIVKKIKENHNAGNIPVIALTARTMKGDKEKMLEAGCDDYISKPVDPDTLLKTIEKWLRTKD